MHFLTKYNPFQIHNHIIKYFSLYLILINSLKSLHLGKKITIAYLDPKDYANRMYGTYV